MADNTKQGSAKPKRNAFDPSTQRTSPGLVAPGTAPAPATGTPATAGRKGGQQMAPKAPTAAPAATGTPATAGQKGAAGQGANPGVGQTPFGMQNFYGGNPLVTAQNQATQALQQQLAGLGQQYAGQGLGNSSREAIARGSALSQFGTGLADVLAQRGEGAYQADANRMLSANQQLANLGVGLTGIGSQEQNLPGMSAILGLLNALSGQSGTEADASRGGSGWWAA